MVNPGAFQGSRRVFLLGEKAAYRAGVEGGYAPDALATIYRRYFKRYPIDLEHNVEPSPEFTAAVNDNAAEPDIEPISDSLDPGEREIEIEKRAQRGQLIDFRKRQIKRWLVYQHMKDNDIDLKDASADRPFNALLKQLTGVALKKPQAIKPVNLWRKTRRNEIEDELKKQIQAARDQGAEEASIRKKTPSMRENIAHSMFKALTQEEIDHWTDTAKEDSEAAMKQWKDAVDSPPSTAPADRQRCIQGLVRVVQPILDLICEATGFHCSLLAGGPEPARNGYLTVVSIHSGTTNDNLKLNFGRAERARYKQYILPIYGDYLTKCFTPEECRSRSLNDNAAESLTNNDVENYGASVDLTMGSNLAASTPKEAAGAPGLPPQALASAASISAPSPAAVLPALSQEAVPREGGAAMPSAPTPLGQASPSPAASPASPHGVPGVPVPPATPQEAAVTRSLPVSATALVPQTPAVQISTAPIQPGLPAPERTTAGPQLPDKTNATVSKRTGGAPSIHDDRTERWDATRIMQRLQEELDDDAYHQDQRESSQDPWALPLPEPSTMSRAASLELSPPNSPSRNTPHSSPVPSVASPTATRGSKRAANTGGDVPEESASGTKRAKTASGRSQSKPQALAPSANIQDADWFVNGKALLSTDRFGASWTALVNAWIDFEEREAGKRNAMSNPPPLVPLKAKSPRPAAIADWIKRARSPIWRPSISNIGKYSEMHVKWWSSLQPDWRIVNSTLDIEKTTGDWEILRKSGSNGLLSILSSLFFWRDALPDSEAEHKDWLTMVSDCASCFEGLA